MMNGSHVSLNNGAPPPPPPLHDMIPPPPSHTAPPPPPSEYITPPPPPDVAPPPPPSDAPEPPRILDNVPPPPISGPQSEIGPSLAAKRKNGATVAPKKNPLSIEEILKKKRESDAAAAKPKFMTKAQREKLALEKRQKEFEEAQAKKAAERPSSGQSNGVRSNGDIPHIASRYPDEQGGSVNRRAVPTGPRALRQGEVPTGPSSMRNGNLPNKGYDMAPPPPPKAVAITGPGGKAPKHDKRPAEEDTEASSIRQRYMGVETNQSTFSAKKKRKRTTEKKFNFEWNTEEDTSADTNPLYKERVEVGFFGRGRLGGFSDVITEEKSREYAKALVERDGDAGSARAAELLDLEKRRKEGSRRHALEKHWSEKDLSLMQERDWRIFKEDFNISTKGGNLPHPMRNWGESGLPDEILRIVLNVGYNEPTPVQRASIPIALQSRDLIGVAVTGSGKTAAFLLPLLVYIRDMPKLERHNSQDGPYAIVLAPTRELAQQIQSEAEKFAHPLGFKVVSIVGGHSIEEQSFQLRDGAEIIIATPGRLVDCIERRVLVLSQCCYVIMDEADRMIDLGFEDPVNRILDALPVSNEKPDSEEAEGRLVMPRHASGRERYRQTMMYTATMPAAVERIARKYLRRPAIVTIGNVGEAVETVEQRVEFVAGEDKRKKRLQEILSSGQFAPPIIVFVNIKRNCDTVARDVKHMGFSSVTLHGSKTQEQREAALASLRNGTTDVLVATDLAGRGIDVPDVSLVVNFNMATNIESYTHRIGRTGRAGKSGIAITFLGNEDADTMYDLKQMLMKSEISRVPEELRKHEAAQQKSTRGQKKIEDSGAFGGKGGWN